MLTEKVRTFYHSSLAVGIKCTILVSIHFRSARDVLLSESNAKEKQCSFQDDFKHVMDHIQYTFIALRLAFSNIPCHSNNSFQIVHSSSCHLMTFAAICAPGQQQAHLSAGVSNTDCSADTQLVQTRSRTFSPQCNIFCHQSSTQNVRHPMGEQSFYLRLPEQSLILRA